MPPAPSGAGPRSGASGGTACSCAARARRMRGSRVGAILRQFRAQNLFPARKCFQSLGAQWIIECDSRRTNPRRACAWRETCSSARTCGDDASAAATTIEWLVVAMVMGVAGSSCGSSSARASPAPSRAAATACSRSTAACAAAQWRAGAAPAARRRRRAAARRPPRSLPSRTACPSARRSAARRRCVGRARLHARVDATTARAVPRRPRRRQSRRSLLDAVLEGPPAQLLHGRGRHRRAQHVRHHPRLQHRPRRLGLARRLLRRRHAAERPHAHRHRPNRRRASATPSATRSGFAERPR